MYPILTRYGSFFLYSYTVVMGVGLLLAVGVAWWEGRRKREEGGGTETGRLEIGDWRLEGRRRPVGAVWLDGVILGLGVAMVVGRVVFVAVNWDYFAGNLDESWLLWQGGISYHGAVGAGFLALWIWSRLRGVRFAWLGDLLALPVAPWSVFGWLACYLEGCAYGRETFIGLMSADLPDSFGVFAVRYQTQMMGLLFSLLALGVLWAVRRRGWLREGLLLWLAVLLLSAGRAVVDAFRGDAMPLLGGVRVDLLLDVALAVGALVVLVVGAVREPPVQREAGGEAM